MQTKEVLFLDWFKIKKTLTQELRGTEHVSRIEQAMNVLPSVVECCGKGSAHRRAILKIARALVPEQPTIYAPCCPDYGHEHGRYNFRGLGSGVSLLAEQHIAFLELIAHLLPGANIIFLLADQEADDEEIRRAVGVDQEEFTVRMQLSLQATRERVGRFGWKANLMTMEIPSLRDAEATLADKVASGASVRARLQNEAISRAEMYYRINPRMTMDDMLQRTIRTAAQYLAMGQFAAVRNAMVCNHTTTNLVWYGETNAAILHNPVSIY